MILWNHFSTAFWYKRYNLAGTYSACTLWKARWTYVFFWLWFHPFSKFINTNYGYVAVNCFHEIDVSFSRRLRMCNISFKLFRTLLHYVILHIIGFDRLFFLCTLVNQPSKPRSICSRCGALFYWREIRTSWQQNNLFRSSFMEVHIVMV